MEAAAIRATSFFIEEELYDEVCEYTKSENISKKEFYNNAVRFFLKKMADKHHLKKPWKKGKA